MFIALCYPYYIVFQVISQHIVLLFLSTARKNAKIIKILSLGIIFENLVTQLVNVLDLTLKSFNQIKLNIILVHTYFQTGELVELKLPGFSNLSFICHHQKPCTGIPYGPTENCCRLFSLPSDD